MGSDKWANVSKRVAKEHAKYMFKFKEGSKRKMLKVQYSRHPEIVNHLYDRFLVAYGNLPWNDEVPIYFVKLFYAKSFLGMKPNYNDLPFEFYGTWSGRIYEHKGALWDIELSHPLPPLVRQPPRLVTFWSKMDATSQIGREGRDAIIDNIHNKLTKIDIGLNQQRP